MTDPIPELTPETIRYLRALNARRARAQVQCVECGTLSAPSYLTRRYCSNLCRQRAKYARMKARARAAGIGPKPRGRPRRVPPPE